MNNQTIDSKMDKYPISMLPECAWLWANTDLRDRLRANTQDARELSVSAKDLVVLHVLGRIEYIGGGSDFLLTLLRKGYTREEVAHALADAWLASCDHFRLPTKSRWAWVNTFWGKLVLSFFMTIGLIGFSMRILARISPKIDLYLMAFPPLLSIVGLVVMTVVYRFISLLMKWWFPQKTSSSGVSN
jgi:hypothetical protein